MKLPRTIKETQTGLLKKDFSAVHLVDGYLARIKKYQSLNAFITVADKVAYEEARKVDELIKNSDGDLLKDKPLLGVVVAHKDLFLTKGIRTTAASKVLESYIPPYNATVVKRISEAGAIIIGKTNCDAWAHGASGENSDFGPTKNPWNETFVPGGSSSGSAAAVAADFCLFATGTDTGGSVRLPASFCGVVGFKPTYGVVSRYGVVAMASSLDCVGHIAHTVQDAKAIFEIVKGQDGYDSTLTDFEPVQSKKLKIGIPREYFTEGVDREVERAVLAAIGIYKKQGIQVVDISLPHTKYGVSAYYVIQPAEVSSNLSRYDAIRYGNDRLAFSNEAKRRIMLGTYVLSAGYYDTYYLKAMKVRSRIIEDFDRVFRRSADGVDAILTPVSPTPAFKLGEKSKNPLEMYLSDILTVNANLAGLPGLSVPAGFTKNNLPIGFQIIGPKFSENILFDLGKLYQDEVDWHKKEALA
ncbi:MAG: Glutamyl-tRNA(Gln) amidotransferase subunit A [Candidatus Woesebacteria bacterium GW2011_GWB1_44_11b]|uniref:Glutamyl-tRNA(Gln) amidotransferase subunit A n=1 Tax=Candidatus Woesebacteria bacterium GW2011_GWB1_44_11b TaxID=1618580 RepID=A0A0G1JCZ5_9BACT|nr:MAG: Glutamyl-tRNA(Gln) amidotransferase subunit A [Candidatus Woesebacteria bacterium GW2011_GWB1_44_11b]